MAEAGSAEADVAKAGKPGAKMADLMNEFGVSGLQRFGGSLTDEFLKELQGEKGRKNLREFAQNDPVAGATLFSIKSLAQGAEWMVKEGSDDPVHVEQAEFIRTALFEDMSTSWPDLLGEVLSMLPFGWSLHEVVYKRRGGETNDPTTRSKFTDGKIGWRKWPIRAQETLDEWEFDENGGIRGMWQDPGMSGVTGGRRFIPIAKALLFRTETEKNSPEGRSVLRNAWTSYYFKKRIQIILGIGIERDLAGYPVFQVKEPDLDKGLIPPDIFSTDANNTDAAATLAMLKKIVKSIRRDEQEGMVLPYWIDFKLVTADGRRQFDLDKILARFDRLIAMTMVSDFLFIGHDGVGSQALVVSRLGLFEQALNGFLAKITGVINRHAIPTLLRLNGMPTDAPPTLEHGPLMKVDLEALGDYILKIAGAGMVLFGENSGDLQRGVLAAARLPDTGVEEEGFAKPPVDPKKKEPEVPPVEDQD